MNNHELNYDRKHSDQKAVFTHNIGFKNFFFKSLSWFLVFGGFLVLGVKAIC